jgi:hypothetical protein
MGPRRKRAALRGLTFSHVYEQHGMSFRLQGTMRRLMIHMAAGKTDLGDRGKSRGNAQVWVLLELQRLRNKAFYEAFQLLR